MGGHAIGIVAECRRKGAEREPLELLHQRRVTPHRELRIVECREGITDHCRRPHTRIEETEVTRMRDVDQPSAEPGDDLFRQRQEWLRCGKGEACRQLLTEVDRLGCMDNWQRADQPRKRFEFGGHTGEGGMGHELLPGLGVAVPVDDRTVHRGHIAREHVDEPRDDGVG